MENHATVSGSRGPVSLSREQRERLIARLTTVLAEEPDVTIAFLYGSFSEGRAFHDIDIGVYLQNEEPTRPPALTDRLLEIADRLSSELHLPVDVRALNSAPPTFAFHVLRGRRLLSRDDDLLARLMAETGRAYLDIEPLLRRATKEAFES